VIEVQCRTNLDLRGEAWPTKLPAVPRVGELIQSSTKWNEVFQLRLKVVAITWRQNHSHDWSVLVELHDAADVRSIKEFYEWYAPLIGTSPSTFI